MKVTRQNSGLVYRKRPERCHIVNDGHKMMGERMANWLELQMRKGAEESIGKEDAWKLLICPGCYMEVVFYAAISLAQRAEQSTRELGRTMAQGFTMLANDPDNLPAFLPVILDDEEEDMQHGVEPGFSQENVR